MPLSNTRTTIDAEPFHHSPVHSVLRSNHATLAPLPSHPAAFFRAWVARAILVVPALVLTGCVENEREIQAVREAARIAEEARHEQAEQTRSFAELETTLSQERQSIDRERAQAAERHDEADKSRETAIQAQRAVNEAAARDKLFGQALLACAPILLVAVALWAALRLTQRSFEGAPDSDSAIAEVLLLESHLKPTWYDPGLAKRLVGSARLGLPDGTNPGDAYSTDDEAPDESQGASSQQEGPPENDSDGQKHDERMRP